MNGQNINLSSSWNNVGSKGPLSITIFLSGNSLWIFWPCREWAFAPLCSASWLRKSITGCCRKSYTNKYIRGILLLCKHAKRLPRHRNRHYKNSSILDNISQRQWPWPCKRHDGSGYAFHQFPLSQRLVFLFLFLCSFFFPVKSL